MWDGQQSASRFCVFYTGVIFRCCWRSFSVIMSLCGAGEANKKQSYRMTKCYSRLQTRQSSGRVRRFGRMLLSLLAIMGLSIPVAARDFTCNGIVYTVLDEEARTCSTKAGVFNPVDSTVTPGNVVKGEVSLFNIVDENGIGYSLKSIGDYSFTGNTELVSIRFPLGIETVGGHAFENCTSLIEIEVIPYIIGEYAFANCTSLSEFDFGVAKKIGKGAFANCTSLVKAEMENIICDIGRAIGEQAFLNCKSLSSIILDGLYTDSLVTIGDKAFYGCDQLTGIYSRLKNPPVISADVFSRYDGVVLSVRPESVDAYKAAENWSRFEIRAISESALKYEVFYDEALGKECAKVVGYEPNLSNKVVVPSEVEIEGKTYPVVEIGDSAFFRCDKFYHLELPESVTRIGDYAFAELDHWAGLNIDRLGEIKSIGKGAFSKCCINVSYITELLNSVSEIGAYAFYESTSSGCNVTINIPETVTSIGEYTFANFTEIEHVNIPESVTSIGRAAFAGCYAIDSITIPKSITEIQDSTFAGVFCAQYLSIPESVTKIGEYAFRKFGNMYLTSVTIPNSVTSIGKGAFYNCEYLKTIKLPDSLTEIPDQMFYYSQALDSIVIPESVTKIGSNAFGYCKSLGSVTIPESVDSIGSNAFQYCTSLTSATLPKSLEIISDRLFYGCSSLAKVSVPESATIIGLGAYCGTAITSVIIPESVTTIQNGAFSGCSKLESVTLPESVTTIEPTVFYGCKALTSIEIPKSLTTIDRMVFANSGLETITIPETVKVIGEQAFSACNSLKTAVIESADSVARYAFSRCKALTSVRFGKSVRKIGELMFVWCDSLKEVTIESADTIGAMSFNTCPSLTTVTLPESLKFIGRGAFYNSPNISKVYVPSMESWLGIKFENIEASPTYYGAELIVAGKSTEVVEIPETTEEVGDYAFAGLTTIKEVVIPEIVEAIGSGSFTGCSGLENINIPETVKTIGETAFKGCTSLISAIIGKIIGAPSRAAEDYATETSTIGNEAFAGCESLDNVSIGANIGSVGESAFAGCGSIKRVDSYAMRAPEAALNSFEEAAQTAATLHVPAGYLDVYQASPVWSAFGTIVDDLAVAERVTISKATASIQEESTLTLTAEATSSKQFEWTSSAPEVASVSETGVVTAHKVGTARITVTAQSGARAFCDITVTAKPSGIEDVDGASAPAVRAEGGEIVIDGNGSATVYSITGARVAATTAGRVSGLPRGIYLVHFGGKTYKVAL